MEFDPVMFSKVAQVMKSKGLNSENFSYISYADLTVEAPDGTMVELRYTAGEGWYLDNSHYPDPFLQENSDYADELILDAVMNHVVELDDTFEEMHGKIIQSINNLDLE